MKKIVVLVTIVGIFAACMSNASKHGKDVDSSAPSSSPDKTAVANDSAKAQSDSLVNSAPDTLKAK